MSVDGFEAAAGMWGREGQTEKRTLLSCAERGTKQKLL